MIVEGAFFVKEALQGSSGNWSIDEIQDEFLVPVTHCVLAGMLYFAKIRLSPAEQGARPSVLFDWVGPGGKILTKDIEVPLTNSRTLRDGSGSSAVRIYVDLRVEEPGLHIAFLRQAGHYLSKTMVYIHLDENVVRLGSG